LVLHGVHRGNAEQAYSYGSLPETPTLAESVKAAGYRTALIHANIFLRRIGGGMRGFEAAYMPPYMRLMTSSGEAIRKSLFPDFLTAHLTGYPSAADVNEGVLRFFAQAKPAPCFVIANYMEAHRPLLPRQPYAELFASMAPRRDESRPLETVEFEAAYDAEIRGLDERLVDLLNSLEKRGQLANTWVFITSDHGEAIGEHAEKIGHGIDVYNNEARIPLVVLPPEGVAIAVMHQAVGLLDVTATVSAIAASTRVGRGRDLRDPTETARATWVELYEKGQPAQPAVRAVIQGRSKLISRHGGTAELYQVLDDPHERVDLATAKPELVQLMSKLTPAKGSPVPHRPVQSNLIGPTLQEAAALRALGYAE
jgi:arylsulfatase A-like enzyme